MVYLPCRLPLLPGRKEFGDLRREDIAKRVKPFVLRRLKGDVLNELPEKIEHLQSSELLPDQKSLYRLFSEAKGRNVKAFRQRYVT